MGIGTNNFLPDFKKGETQIIFQRHSNYDRENGTLIETDNTIKTDINYFNNLLGNLTEEEKSNLYIFFIASNTIGKNGLMRAFDTTEIARTIATVQFEENGINTNHIINSKTKQDTSLVEPNMFIDNTGYFEYLKEKYDGINRDFWVAFEEDIEKQFRMTVFGEGPDEIVDRAMNYLTAIKKYSDFFHSKNPNSRLIVWSGTHYDLISPLVKQIVLKVGKEEEVMVDYNGGIAINITEKGDFITSINEVYYNLGDLNNMQHHRHF